MFNDDWMREKGFLEKTGMTARDLVASGLSGELLAIEGSEPVETAVTLMSEHDFSQISITRDKRLVGSLNEIAPLRASWCRNADDQDAAGRDHHAAGVPVRRHLDAGRPAVDDDHAARTRRCWSGTSRPRRRSSSRGRTSFACCAEHRSRSRHEAVLRTLVLLASSPPSAVACSRRLRPRTPTPRGKWDLAVTHPAGSRTRPC